MMKLTVGCDPEVFLRDEKTKKFISADGLVPGTKRAPHKLDKGAVQVDGTAMEFNPDPASTVSEFVSNLTTVLTQCRAMLPSHISMVPQPVVQYDEDYYNSLREETKVLGCDPDYDAFSGLPNRIPEMPANGVRMAGGHLVLGWTEGKDSYDWQHINDCREIIKKLDCFYCSFHKFWDKDSIRPQFYGSSCRYRPKPYGVEYRTPSNAWLAHDDLWPWIFESIQWVFDRSISGKIPEGMGYPWMYFKSHGPNHNVSSLKTHLKYCFGTADVPFPPKRILEM